MKNFILILAVLSLASPSLTLAADKPRKASKKSASKSAAPAANHDHRPSNVKGSTMTATKEVWKCQGCGMTHDGPGRCCGMELKKI